MPSALIPPEEASAVAFCKGCVPESFSFCPSSICWPNTRHPPSLRILPCCIPSVKEEADVPFHTWDHCVILVIHCVFPVSSFLKGRLLSGTHHFQASAQPASSRLLDAASSSLRTPRRASFWFCGGEGS